MSSSTFQHRRRNRLRIAAQSGFTLVELLVVIAIIGILVGLLLVAGRGVVIRANEFAVTTEITQMSQALEEFKTKYGFYPPSRIPGTNAAEKLTALKRILARISPNHRHTDAELDAWQTSIGDNLHEGSSLVFWLARLSQNKQLPLSATGPFEMFYEFEDSRLLDSGTGPGSGGYEMEYGKSIGSRTFLYFGSTSYSDYATATVDDFKPYTRIVDGSVEVINPSTFQIYCAGIDADFGSTSSSGSGSGGDIASQGVKARDNLCNFANGGRLEVYVANN